MRWIMLPLLAFLPGGCAAPALHSYLLGAAPPPSAGSSISALPADLIELRPVLLPDHLDTSAILRRSGTNELVASRNGRWADRLSVGIRQALATDLQTLLPQAAIVTSSPPQPGFQRISLTIAGFEPDGAGTLTLQASWIIETTRPAAVLERRRARLVVNGVANNDAAQVTAMAGLLEQLATAIAQGL